MKKAIKSYDAGMSLIEVMIVMTIMSLIGLGTATLMKNMFSIQRRSSLKAVASEIKNDLETVLKNDTAWGFAINANPSLSCLQDAVGACAHSPFSGDPAAPGASLAADINVFDSTGASWYDSTNAASGFSADDGQICRTFAAAAGGGNDDCPFRYNISIFTECPGGVGPCNKPQVTILATMVFNPADPSDSRNRLNVDDFVVSFRRGERVRYEPLEIIHSETDETGGGDCTGNTWVPRILSSIRYDIGGNAAIVNGPGGEFSLASGTYECKVIAQGYEAIDGFSIRLLDLTTNNPIPIGGAYSGWNSSAYVTGTVQIERASATTFRIEHFCADDSVGESSAHDYGSHLVAPDNGCAECEMGIPAPSAGGGYGGSETVYTTITCVRSS